MGDRVSISFKCGHHHSVVLFSHSDGQSFVDRARQYAERLLHERKGHYEPLDRFEPNTVMVDFIRDITTGLSRVTSNLYLGKDLLDGDNSDNGHYVIEFICGENDEQQEMRFITVTKSYSP